MVADDILGDLFVRLSQWSGMDSVKMVGPHSCGVLHVSTFVMQDKC